MDPSPQNGDPAAPLFGLLLLDIGNLSLACGLQLNAHAVRLDTCGLQNFLTLLKENIEKHPDIFGGQKFIVTRESIPVLHGEGKRHRKAAPFIEG